METDKSQSRTLRPQRRRRGRNIPAEIQKIVTSLVLDGLGKAAIYDLLSRSDLGNIPLPSSKTIGRYIDDIDRHDVSGQWSFGDPVPEDPRSVLAALAALVVETKGRITSITKLEAVWISRILNVAPLTQPHTAWKLSRLYIMRKAHDQETKDLDAYLAFTGGGQTFAEYRKAIDEEWIPGPPMLGFIDFLAEAGEAMTYDDQTLLAGADQNWRKFFSRRTKRLRVAEREQLAAVDAKLRETQELLEILKLRRAEDLNPSIAERAVSNPVSNADPSAPVHDGPQHRDGDLPPD
ncbi:MAG: hypothetical protein AB7K36_27255 [Chloroflexota bacterium]